MIIEGDRNSRIQL